MINPTTILYELRYDLVFRNRRNSQLRALSEYLMILHDLCPLEAETNFTDRPSRRKKLY